MKKLTLGCDPELFLQDASGAVHSAIGLVGGSKYDPRPLYELGEGFSVQEDNVAVEFKTPPAEFAEGFDSKGGRTVDFLQQFVKERYGLSFAKMSAISFPDSELSNPMAHVFGCDPDFNAWTGRINPKPKASDPNLRSCGGHVHIGYKFKNKTQARRAIKLVELFTGVPSVLVDVDGDKRRILYGKPGAFRYKPYGAEYRTLSNFWVFDSNLRKWVYNNVERALELLDTDFDVDSMRDPIYQAIENNDKKMAKKLVKEYRIAMP